MIYGSAAYFHSSDFAPADRKASIQFVPTIEQQGSIQWPVYCAQLVDIARRYGISVNEVGSADLYCRATIQVDADGEPETRDRLVYINNQQTYAGKSTRLVHQRVLILEFFRSRSEAEAIETVSTPIILIRVLSQGSNNEIALVLPGLAKLAFSEWPGESGKVYQKNARLEQ